MIYFILNIIDILVGNWKVKFVVSCNIGFVVVNDIKFGGIRNCSGWIVRWVFGWFWEEWVWNLFKSIGIVVLGIVSIW